jgi:hypothetical protein
MTTVQEMPIPKGRSDSILLSIFSIVFVFFTVLAVFNLLNWQGVIASILWLGVVAIGIWISVQDEGGFRSFAIKFMGTLVGKKFAEIVISDNRPVEVRFGFQFFWRRHIL